MRKTSIWLLCLATMFIAVSICQILYFSNKQSRQVLNQSVSWTSYSNSMFAYTLSYPTNWHLDTSFSYLPFSKRNIYDDIYVAGDTSISNYPMKDLKKYPTDNLEISLHFVESNPILTPTQYTSKLNKDYDRVSIENISINGLLGIKRTAYGVKGSGIGGRKNVVTFILQDDNKLALFSYNFDDLNKNVIPTAESIIYSFNRVNVN